MTVKKKEGDNLEERKKDGDGFTGLLVCVYQ